MLVSARPGASGFRCSVATEESGAVSPLDRVVLARADEQITTLDPREPDGPDPWAIRETAPGAPREGSPGKLFSCIGCGSETRHYRSFCARCRKRIAVGLPVDVESFPTQRDARRLRELMPSGTWRTSPE